MSWEDQDKPEDQDKWFSENFVWMYSKGLQWQCTVNCSVLSFWENRKGSLIQLVDCWLRSGWDASPSCCLPVVFLSSCLCSTVSTNIKKHLAPDCTYNQSIALNLITHDHNSSFVYIYFVAMRGIMEENSCRNEWELLIQVHIFLCILHNSLCVYWSYG